MNTFPIETAWIIFHLSLTICPFIEASKFPERCIYKDYEDIRLKIPSLDMKLHIFLACEICKYQKIVYTMTDILRAVQWLSLMRILSTLPFMLVLLIIVLPTLDKLFISDLNIDNLVNTVIWPILYGVEFFILVLRLKSKAVRILKLLHPQYADISLYSILTFKYIKK